MSTAITPAPVEVIYTAPTGNRTVGRIHRATCKHIAKTATRFSPAEASVALFDATLATCCSVREIDREAAIAVARAAAEAEAERAAAGAAASVPAPRTPATRPGSLRDLVEAHLRQSPGAAFTPYQIGKALDRSSGAVSNALDKLAGLGVAIQTCDKPRTFQLADAAAHG